MKPATVWDYLVAVGAVVLTVGVKLALDPLLGKDKPFLLLFAAVMVSAWLGGLGPGLLATALSSVASAYYFMDPGHSLAIGAKASTQVGVFVLECLLLCVLSSSRRKGAAALDSALRRSETALKEQSEAEQQVMLLVDASGAFLTALEPSQVLQKILDLARKFIQADAYAVWRIDAAHGGWKIVSSVGLPESYPELYSVSTPQDSAYSGVILDRAVAIEDVEESPMVAARKETYRLAGIRSLLVVPLRIHGDTSATITFYYHSRHASRDSELRIATVLGNLAASAIATAELYEDQRALRAESEHRERQSVFIGEATRTLAASLDYQTTLSAVARLAVPHFADWCSVHIIGESGEIQQLAVAHADPAKVEWAREISHRYPPTADDPGGVWQVLKTGEIRVVNNVSEDTLVAFARDAGHLKAIREVGINSFLGVPLIARGRTLGAITFVKSAPGQIFDDADLELAQHLGRRAAIAMDNAALYQTAERRREEAETTAELLRQSNEDLEQFAYVSSHDLQEPLRTISSYVQLIQRRYQGKLDADADEFIGFVVEGVSRMQLLLTDLLEYSRVSHQGEPARTESDAALDAAVQNLRATIDGSQANITHDPLPAVRIVPSQLTQLFQNLIGNAIKFRSELPPRIHIGAERSNGDWVFSVRDNGVGFDPRYAKKIFVIFQRLHGRQYSGTGVGLAISKRIVERHGGKIWVDSQPGRGSVFYFSLPAEP